MPSRILSTLALALAIAPAAGAGAADPADPAIAAARRQVRAFRDADLIVVGRVIEVHRSPGVWCGIVATRQQVTFGVEAVLAGECGAPEVRAAFFLVSGSALVDREARLNPALFRPGSRWRLCLTRDGEWWQVADEEYSAELLETPPPAPRSRAAVLQAVLDAPALAAWLHPEVEGRIPLAIVETEAVRPPPVLFAGGAPVRILPAARIGDRPALAFTKVELDGATASVALSYPVEGVSGTVELSRVEGLWQVTRTRLVER